MLTDPWPKCLDCFANIRHSTLQTLDPQSPPAQFMLSSPIQMRASPDIRSHASQGLPTRLVPKAVHMVATEPRPPNRFNPIFFWSKNTSRKLGAFLVTTLRIRCSKFSNNGNDLKVLLAFWTNSLTSPCPRPNVDTHGTPNLLENSLLSG